MIGVKPASVRSAPTPLMISPPPKTIMERIFCAPSLFRRVLTAITASSRPSAMSRYPLSAGTGFAATGVKLTNAAGAPACAREGATSKLVTAAERMKIDRNNIFFFSWMFAGLPVRWSVSHSDLRAPAKIVSALGRIVSARRWWVGCSAEDGNCLYASFPSCLLGFACGCRTLCWCHLGLFFAPIIGHKSRTKTGRSG